MLPGYQKLCWRQWKSRFPYRRSKFPFHIFRLLPHGLLHEHIPDNRRKPLHNSQNPDRQFRAPLNAPLPPALMQNHHDRYRLLPYNISSSPFYLLTGSNFFAITLFLLLPFLIQFINGLFDQPCQLIIAFLIIYQRPAIRIADVSGLPIIFF